MHRSSHERSPRRPTLFFVFCRGVPHPEPEDRPSNSPISGLTTPIRSSPVRLKKQHHQLAPSVGTTVPFQIRLITQLVMVSTRNISRSNANPPRMQNQPSDVDSRPPGTIEATQAYTDEVEALRLTNQRMVGELEQLTRQMQQSREVRQTQEGRNAARHEGQPHPGTPRGAVTEAESSRARGHGPPLTPGEEDNEAALGGHVGNNELNPRQQGKWERSWEQRFKGLQQELNRVKEVIKGRAPNSMDNLVQQTESPFTAEVLHFPLPTKCRMPQIEVFDGTKDPVDHLNTYKNQMELHGYQDPIRCRAFAITLKGPALTWFNRLPPSSITSFRERSIAFISHFIRARTYKKLSYHLLTIKQSSQESMRSYVQRFNAESLKVDITNEKFAITAFIAGLGLQSKDLMFSISKNPPKNMAKVLAKAEKYINGEESLISKKASSSNHKEKSGTDKRQGRSPKRQRDRERSPKKDSKWSSKRRGGLRDRLGPPQPERRQHYSPRRFTPLTVAVSQVLRKVQHKQFLKWLSQMRSNPTKRDNTRYCEFHRDYGHRTDDYIQLKKEIEYLIRRGYLRRFIAPKAQAQNQAQAQQPPPPPRQATT